MVGNDTNADILQLGNRIDGTVQCVNILESHPEWGGEARRLRVGPLQGDVMNISNKYDHLNPRSWKGDVHVNQVVLVGSWNEGCRVVEEELWVGEVDAPFIRMQQEGGYGILCPFGNNKIVLVDGLQSDERDEGEDERDIQVPATIGDDTPAAADDIEGLEPDLDDLAGIVEASNLAGEHAPAPSPFVSIDPNDPASEKAHKASVLRLYSSPLTITESRDRLKRVCGYSRYDESKLMSAEAPSPAEDDDSLHVQDPAATLVNSDSHQYFAIIQILSIQHDGKNVQSIPGRFISEPNVCFRQIMKLGLITQGNDHQPDAADWEWNGSFEARAVFRDLDGHFIQQINPDRQRASRGRNAGEDTYVLKSSELRAIAAVMYERLYQDGGSFPSAPLSDSFPYRSITSECVEWIKFRINHSKL
jgi:hypothetical protein